MPARSIPRLNLIDLMVLVAGMALGLSWTAAFRASFSSLLAYRLRFEPGDYRLFEVLPSVLGLTLTYLVIGLRPPRSRRAVARRPGIMACVAAILTAIAIALRTFHLFHATGAPLRLSAFSFQFLVWCKGPPGYAVAATWIAMRLVGCWEPGPDAIDRLGRLLGVAWIGLSAAAWFGF